jgi:2-iminobutanoate/2-iminopropanoate deaminase
MTRQAISTGRAPAPAGPYSQAMRARGNFVFLAGQTPRTIAGERMTAASFEGQARQALDNLAAVAQAAGLSLADAVKVTVYLRDPRDAAQFNAIYREYFSDPLPPRTLVQSSFVGFDVEIDAILLDGSHL